MDGILDKILGKRTKSSQITKKIHISPNKNVPAGNADNVAKQMSFSPKDVVTAGNADNVAPNKCIPSARTCSGMSGNVRKWSGMVRNAWTPFKNL